MEAEKDQIKEKLIKEEKRRKAAENECIELKDNIQ